MLPPFYKPLTITDMKKYILLLIALFIAVGPCMAQRQKKEKKMSEKELKVAQAVSYKMYQKDLVMYMTAVATDYGRLALDGIKISLIDDKFTCNLPYQGSSRINTYGSQNISITCTDCPVEVESIYNEKKSYYKLNFEFESSYDKEKFLASLKIFLNGKVTLELSSSRRGMATYTGGLFIQM